MRSACLYGSSLGLCWGQVVPMLGQVAPILSYLGPIGLMLGQVGAHVEPLGLYWPLCWAHLGSMLGLCWDYVGLCWAYVAHVGPSWELCWGHVWAIYAETILRFKMSIFPPRARNLASRWTQYSFKTPQPCCANIDLRRAQPPPQQQQQHFLLAVFKNIFFFYGVSGPSASVATDFILAMFKNIGFYVVLGSRRGPGAEQLAS